MNNAQSNIKLVREGNNTNNQYSGNYSNTNPTYTDNNNNNNNNQAVSELSQNQPQYVRYSVSHSGLPPPDAVFNQFTRGFSILNKNISFGNLGLTQQTQPQQTIPAVNQDTPVFSSTYTKNPSFSLPLSLAGVGDGFNNNNLQTTTKSVVNSSDNNNNANNITVLDPNQHNIVFNPSIFNNNDNNNTHSNLRNPSGGSNSHFSMDPTTVATNIATSGITMPRPKRKSSILFFDPNEVDYMDWNTQLDNLNFIPSNNNNNEENCSRNGPQNKKYPPLQPDDTLPFNYSGNNIPVRNDSLRLGPLELSTNHNIVNDKDNQQNKRNTSFQNMLFGDKYTMSNENVSSEPQPGPARHSNGNNDHGFNNIPFTITENIPVGSKVISPGELNVLLNRVSPNDATINEIPSLMFQPSTPTKDDKISDGNTRIIQSNIKNDVRAKPKTRSNSGDSSNSGTSGQNSLKEIEDDRTNTPVGATKIDQLMLMIEARQKGVTDEIKTDTKGDLLLDQNPKVVPDKKSLIGGVTKPKTKREHITLSPLKNDVLLHGTLTNSPTGQILSDLEDDHTVLVDNVSRSLTDSPKQAEIKSETNMIDSNLASLVTFDDNIHINEIYPNSDQKLQKNECPYCHHHFIQPTHLEVHLRSHSGYRPYKCKYCDKRFTQGGNLRTHEKLHTGLKPYECNICKRKFSRKGNLRAHMFTHDELKPFVCHLDNCNKTFTQLGNMKAHQNRFHKETVLHLANKLAKWNPQTDIIPEEDRKLLEYFASLYKNSNKGIKGRGKGTSKIKLVSEMSGNNDVEMNDVSPENITSTNDNNNNATTKIGNNPRNNTNQISPIQTNSITDSVQFDPGVEINKNSNYTTIPMNTGISTTSNIPTSTNKNINSSRNGLNNNNKKIDYNVNFSPNINRTFIYPDDSDIVMKDTNPQVDTNSQSSLFPEYLFMEPITGNHGQNLSNNNDEVRNNINNNKSNMYNDRNNININPIENKNNTIPNNRSVQLESNSNNISDSNSNVNMERGNNSQPINFKHINYRT